MTIYSTFRKEEKLCLCVCFILIGSEVSGGGGSGGSMASSGHANTLASFPGGSPAVVGAPAGSPSLSTGHLMTHQTIQVRENNQSKCGSIKGNKG